MGYDWSLASSEEQGPPLQTRFDAESASEKVSKFFEIDEKVEREDTFKLVASSPN